MHQKVKAFYAQTKLDYVNTVQDNLEEKFEALASPHGRTKTVLKFYRVKMGGLKSHEYLWYTERETGTEGSGNDISVERVVGKYEMPVAQYKLNDNQQREAIGLSDLVTEYDLPWSPKLLDEMEEKGMITDRTQCYVQDASRTYGQFYFDPFKSAEFEDLVFLGINGEFPTLEQKAILSGPPSKRMGQQQASKQTQATTG